MTRVTKRGLAGRRHRKVLKKAKGYCGARKNVFRVAKQAVIKAAQYNYRDRRQRKRQFRALWIVRISAAVRERGLTYSRFISGLKKASIYMDRRLLSDLAINDQSAFSLLVDQAKMALDAEASAS